MSVHVMFCCVYRPISTKTKGFGAVLLMWELFEHFYCSLLIVHSTLYVTTDYPEMQKNQITLVYLKNIFTLSQFRL